MSQSCSLKEEENEYLYFNPNIEIPKENNNEDVAPKITFIGTGGTGKTSLIHRFADNDFSDECDPTIFENLFLTIEIGNTPVNLNIWDTAGQEVYDSIIPLTYVNSSIGILCYSIVDKNSFAQVEEKWIRELRHHSPDSEVLLIGTKSDLRKKLDPEDCISHEEGEHLAKKINAIGFFECSAKEGKNCKAIFIFIAKHEFHKKFYPDPAIKTKRKSWIKSLFCC